MKTRFFLVTIFFVTVVNLALMASHTHGMGYGARAGNSSVQFSPDAKTIAFSYGFWPKIRPVRLIDLETGKIIRMIPVESAVSDLLFSSDGDLLAVSITIRTEPSKGVIRVYDINTGDEVGHTDTPAVFFIRFLEDNKTVAYHDFGEIMLWNIENGTAKKSDLKFSEVSHSADEPAYSHAISAERSISARAERKEAAPIVVKDSKTDEILKELPVDGTVRSLFFDSDGETLAVLAHQGKFPVQLWDTGTWTIRQSYYPQSQPVEGAFSRDGKLLAVHLEDNTLRIWDLKKEKEIKSVSFLLPREQFLEAAEKGDLRLLKALIADGIDIETKESYNGRSAMLIAAAEGHLHVVRFFHEAGFSLDEEDSHGYSASRLAADGGHTDVVQYLLAEGADIDLAEALYSAASGGHTETVRVLLSAGADVNARNISDTTALMRAARGGHTDVVKTLLEDGAVRNKDIRSALKIAQEEGHLDVVNVLREASAKD